MQKANRGGERESGVAGVLWARRKLADHGRTGTIDFSVNADSIGGGAPYLKQARGAFGAAYESQIKETWVLPLRAPIQAAPSCGRLLRRWPRRLLPCCLFRRRKWRRHHLPECSIAWTSDSEGVYRLDP